MDELDCDDVARSARCFPRAADRDVVDGCDVSDDATDVVAGNEIAAGDRGSRLDLRERAVRKDDGEVSAYGGLTFARDAVDVRLCRADMVQRTIGG